MDVSEAIRTKRAVRKFEDKPMAPEAVRAILNAARRAQSSKNSQPWQFVAIQEKERLKALSECGTFAQHIAGAALCVAAIAPPPETRFSVMLDVGQSLAYAQLEAWNMGIGSCLATIYETEKAQEILGFPADLECHIAVSFGYPVDMQVFSRPNKPGGRRPLDEIVHWEKW